jgi:hypothetical protein
MNYIATPTNVDLRLRFVQLMEPANHNEEQDVAMVITAKNLATSLRVNKSKKYCRN